MNIVINRIINKWNLNKEQPIDLNQLKINVIQGIENEIIKTNDELEKLKKDLESFPELYCDKYEHHYYVTNYERIGETGWHSFAGYETIYHISYKCSICGHDYFSEGATYEFPHIEYKKQEFPKSAYDDKNLQIDGRTYRMVLEEISRLEDNFKKRICELAGHRMKRSSYYKCTCCGKIMSFDEYREYLKSKPIAFTKDIYSALPKLEKYQDGKNQEENSNYKPKIITREMADKMFK
ncbi:MAG: hypothetical protein IJF92_04305 [Bacilli bacterium]|nr:hypothetical protein [Bacilli bacterium]